MILGLSKGILRFFLLTEIITHMEEKQLKGGVLNVGAFNSFFFVCVLSCDQKLDVCRQTYQESEQKWKL